MYIKCLYVPADQRKEPVMEYQKWQAYPGCHTLHQLCYANKYTASVGAKAKYSKDGRVFSRCLWHLWLQD